MSQSQLKITHTELHLYYDALGRSIFVPIIELQSETPGPHTVLSALNHGDEILALDAAFRNIDKLNHDPNFQGKITLLTTLNYEGFNQANRHFVAEYLNSSGLLNLNRSYNNHAKNLTTQAANKILSCIKSLTPDFTVDLHTYAQNSLIHLILDRPGGRLEAQMIDIAQRSKLPFYLEYEPSTLKEQQLDFALSNQLCLENICAFTLELGPKRGFDMVQAKIAELALQNLLYVIGHTRGKADTIYQDLPLDYHKLYNRVGIFNESEFSGYFRPLVEIGTLIYANQPIAEILNLRGKVVHTQTAPHTGIIMCFEEEAMVYPGRQFAVIIKEQ